MPLLPAALQALAGCLLQAARAVAVAESSPEDSVVLMQAQVQPRAQGGPLRAERAAAAWGEDEESRAAVEGLGLQADSFRQPLLNFGDAQYTAYFRLGRQLLAGIIDTGSYELVAFGAECSSCGVAAHYSGRLSRTYAETALSMQQFYGSGHLISTAARERLELGPFAVPDQAFWNARYSQMPALNSAAFEAIVGMGPPETPLADAWQAADQAVAAVTAAYSQGTRASVQATDNAARLVSVANVINNNWPLLRSLNIMAFSFCLGARHGADGVVFWNDTSMERRPELFQRVPVMDRRSWSALVANVSVALGKGGAARVEVPGCELGCRALLDSGTTLLAMPSPVIEKLREAMELLDTQCSNLDVLPDLAFELGGATVSLTPDAYVALLDGPPPEHVQQHLLPDTTAPGRRRRHPEVAPQPRAPQRQCQLLAIETNVNTTSGPLWVLGMPFFRKYYTTFSLGQSSQRAMFVSPHTQDECEPSTEEKFRASFKHQLRRISAAKIRLPLIGKAGGSGGTWP